MQDQLPPSTERYHLNPRVLCRAVEDEAVLLDLDAGQYYGLNSVGYRIWSLLVDGHGIASICDAISCEFEISTDAVRPDVEAFIDSLCSRRLLLSGSSAYATR
ncbi:MAG: PqqD family protein [Chloroflexota bacterium]|nr:PqqD family protein [Chloroflexota bacterium]